MKSWFPENPEILIIPRRLKWPYSWIGHIPFAFHLVKLLQPRIIVELGVHTGNSFSAICQAVKFTGSNSTVYGVDTWQGDEHAGFYDRAIYDELHNDISTNYGDFAHLLRMRFDEALSSFSDGSIDLLHIDGLHTYEAVRHDFETWLPKLSERGVVMFHDTSVRRDEFGVWKLWEEISERYPSVEFKHSFGLGVAAIGKVVDPKLAEFFEHMKQNPGDQELFLRLGNSLRWLAELEEFNKLTGGLEHWATEKKSWERRLEDFGLRNAHIAQLSLDCGQGFVEELTVRKEVDGTEEVLEYDLRSIAPGRVLIARFFPFNHPVAVRLERIEVVDSAQTTHSIFEYQSQHTFEEDGLLVFQSLPPEIRFDMSEIAQPEKILIHLEYVAYGMKFQDLLLARMKRGVDDAGLVFSERTGRVFLTPQFAEHLSLQEAGVPATGEVKSGKGRAFDEKLLAAAIFLHKELRAKDALIQQKTSELHGKQAKLAQREASLETEIMKRERPDSFPANNTTVLQLERSNRDFDQGTVAKLRNKLLSMEFAMVAELDRQRIMIEQLEDDKRQEQTRFHEVVTDKDRLFRQLENHLLMTVGDFQRRLDEKDGELCALRTQVASLSESANGAPTSSALSLRSRFSRGSKGRNDSSPNKQS